MTAMLRKLLLTVPVTLVFSGACFAQMTAIEGDVKGEDGKGIKDAVIKVERKDQKGNYKPTKTDKKGHYYYGGFPKGHYVVTLEIDGKEIDHQDIPQTNLGDSTVVNFDMKEINARAKAASTVSNGGALSKEQEKAMTPEQKAAYEKSLKENQAKIAKNKELNDAFNAGRTAEEAKNYAAAVEAFEKASTLDATQHVVWGHLGDCYAALAKTKAGPERDQALEKADGAYLKAIEIKPDASEYHINYAITLANQKKIPEAQAELQKAIAIDPTQAGKCYYNLGAVLVNTNQTDAAVEAFHKSVAADPNYADAYYQLGLTLMGKVTMSPDGKMVAAPGTIDAFQKYLALAPDGPNAATAKEMLTSLGTTVDTGFAKPGEKKATPKKKQ